MTCSYSPRCREFSEARKLQNVRVEIVRAKPRCRIDVQSVLEESAAREIRACSSKQARPMNGAALPLPGLSTTCSFYAPKIAAKDASLSRSLQKLIFLARNVRTQQCGPRYRYRKAYCKTLTKKDDFH